MLLHSLQNSRALSPLASSLIGRFASSTRTGLQIPRVCAASSHRTLSSSPSYGPVPPPKEGVDWDKLGFSLTQTESMYVSTCDKGETMPAGKLEPFGPLPLTPAATIISYGQGIFEGMKAYRTVDDRIVIFRPFENAKRFKHGANRFLMSPVPKKVFVDAVKTLVRDNAHWVPPVGKGTLYLRPNLFGCGSAVGVGPSTQYMFTIYATPVGRYFKGPLRGINLLACDTHHRAATKGVGDVKAAGNYAACFESQKMAKDLGFDEALYLDAKHEGFVEEAGAANFFCVTSDNVIRTPPLGTILAGVTRMSVIQLLQDKGYSVEEAPLNIDMVMNATEAFCSGTGAAITPVGSITHAGHRKSFQKSGRVGPVTQQIFDELSGLHEGRVPDVHGWIHDVYSK